MNSCHFHFFVYCREASSESVSLQKCVQAFPVKVCVQRVICMFSRQSEGLICCRGSSELTPDLVAFQGPDSLGLSQNMTSSPYRFAFIIRDLGGNQQVFIILLLSAFISPSRHLASLLLFFPQKYKLAEFTQTWMYLTKSSNIPFQPIHNWFRENK